jgi:hypothetical protein
MFKNCESNGKYCPSENRNSSYFASTDGFHNLKPGLILLVQTALVEAIAHLPKMHSLLLKRTDQGKIWFLDKENDVIHQVLSTILTLRQILGQMVDVLSRTSDSQPIIPVIMLYLG